MTFSGFMYEHLCYDLILESCLEKPSDYEKMVREILPRQRGLLDECQNAATANQNHKLIEMLNQVRAYLDLWDEAINRRIEEGHIHS